MRNLYVLRLSFWLSTVIATYGWASEQPKDQTIKDQIKVESAPSEAEKNDSKKYEINYNDLKSQGFIQQYYNQYQAQIRSAGTQAMMNRLLKKNNITSPIEITANQAWLTPGIESWSSPLSAYNAFSTNKSRIYLNVCFSAHMSGLNPDSSTTVKDVCIQFDKGLKLGQFGANGSQYESYKNVTIPYEGLEEISCKSNLGGIVTLSALDPEQGQNRTLKYTGFKEIPVNETCKMNYRKFALSLIYGNGYEVGCTIRNEKNEWTYFGFYLQPKQDSPKDENNNGWNNNCHAIGGSDCKTPSVNDDVQITGSIQKASLKRSQLYSQIGTLSECKFVAKNEPSAKAESSVQLPAKESVGPGSENTKEESQSSFRTDPPNLDVTGATGSVDTKKSSVNDIPSSPPDAAKPSATTPDDISASDIEQLMQGWPSDEADSTTALSSGVNDSSGAQTSSGPVTQGAPSSPAAPTTSTVVTPTTTAPSTPGAAAH